MSFYLLEIGSEELPAGFVPLTVNYVKEEAKKQLEAMCLDYKELLTGGTPRRVYLYIDGLPQKQADREETVQGPPAKIAFNEDGSVSEVGLKFAKSKGLDESTLTKVSTDKGDYLSGVKKLKGEDTSKLISEMATQIIKNIPFPKSMRWADRDIRFGRPLKYLMSLFDGKILELGVEGFNAVDTVLGHRFLAPAPIKLADFNSYISGLKKAFVIVDEADRKASIEQQMNELAKKGGYELDLDAELLDTVTNLVEYPFAVEGVFEEAFLQLPSPVLITSMKVHQKYFPTYKGGKLQSKFIGISNMDPANGGNLISEGYARVLRARLNDALFFYNNDKKKPLINMVEMLKKVTYQEKLGTSYEKMERFRALALDLAKELKADASHVEKAATLAKADLMSEMVYEFPELQGFMGKVYAEIQGEDKEVATAIEEHYMPRFAGDDLPSTQTGRIVAVADKLDTIAGAFSIDMIPTGNVDPYGLRRNAIGIINIIEGAGWRMPLGWLLNDAIDQLAGKATADKATTYEKLRNFFIQRHKQLMIAQGETDADAYDAAAVEGSVIFDFVGQRKRARALTEAKKTENFKTVAQNFKRINNILKKSGYDESAVDSALFEQDEEKKLYKTYQELEKIITEYAGKEEWDKATAELSKFADVLADFFDKVMVNADNEALRNNRLRLLTSLYRLFVQVGDLGEIV